MGDAQQSLHTLLTPTSGSGHPQILSPSGALRNQSRGRIAGPTPPDDGSDRRRGPLLEGGSAPDRPSTSLVPGSLYTEGEIKHVQEPGRSIAITRAAESLQLVRDRAQLLLDAVDDRATPDPALIASRHAASRWATRYATHLVILLVVGALLVFGGLRAFTVRGAYNHDMQSVQAYAGTDSSGEGSEEGSDFNLTMPRTQLSTGPANGASGQAGGSASSAQVATVSHYTVVAGDTVQSIAAKFNLMPESVMGSNGIVDPQQDVAPGAVLAIPPLDGMVYVAAQGDTVDTIAQRFQVDPASIVAFKTNGLSGAAVKPGQEIVVPGGMMPARVAALTYTVKQGDTLKGIANRFGIDVPTIINSNNIADPDNLQPGARIRVLPVSGLEYKVKKGDTIFSIADRFGITPQMILDYSPNHVSVDSKLQIDQVLTVPGGRPEQQTVAAARIEPSSRGATGSSQQPQSQPQAPAPAKTTKQAPAPQPKSSTSGAVAKPSNSPKVGTGRMVWPVNGVITQYFSSHHNGLDIAAPSGTPLHAADAGKVVWAGWRTDGLGYCVIIDHLNGLVTVYGHQVRQPVVYVGQYVSRGQLIGYVGSTGHSTGPHVHFMVKVGMGHNYRNPLAYLGG